MGGRISIKKWCLEADALVNPNNDNLRCNHTGRVTDESKILHASSSFQALKSEQRESFVARKGSQSETGECRDSFNENLGTGFLNKVPKVLPRRRKNSDSRTSHESSCEDDDGIDETFEKHLSFSSCSHAGSELYEDVDSFYIRPSTLIVNYSQYKQNNSKDSCDSKRNNASSGRSETSTTSLKSSGSNGRLLPIDDIYNALSDSNREKQTKTITKHSAKRDDNHSLAVIVPYLCDILVYYAMFSFYFVIYFIEISSGVKVERYLLECTEKVNEIFERFEKFLKR